MKINALAAVPLFRFVERRPDVVLAFAVSFLVSMLIVPLPSFLLDGLIAVNISCSLVVLLVALFARNVLEVSSFPSLLLITTLFRLGLNVSATRGILAHGEAGDMVKAFGAFVVQGDVVVGLVIFLVVTLVQFLVVAKGAERVAEVGARFTLDAMPGKQMSIDAAVRNGSITEEEAQDKRDDLNRASQMFGNMDGAMKFVKGDAIAGLVITFINLIGGLLMGVFRHDLSFAEATQVYSVLTVGEALIAQIGALLITLAAAVIVTRVETKDKTKNLGFAVKEEVFGNTKVLNIGAVLLLVLACIPGLPTLPFLVCSVAMAMWSASRLFMPALAGTGDAGRALAQHKMLREKLEKKVAEAKQQKAISDNLSPSVVPIGLDLDPVLSRALGFIDESEDDNAELVKVYIPQLRDALYLQTGVRFPGVRVRPHVAALPESSFSVRINDVPVLQERVPADAFLATVPPDRLQRLAVEAKPVLHPISKAKMSLIAPEAKEVVEAAGVTVWNTAGMVALYMASVLRSRAKAFIGLQEVSELMERLEKAYPALVKEVVPKVATLQQLVNVLKRLVEEQVNIRDLKTIIEALGEFGTREGDPVWLTERVRASLASQLAFAHAGLENRMPVVLLDGMIEDTIASAIHSTSQGMTLSLEAEVCRQVVSSIAQAMQPVVASGKRPVILTNSEIRRFVRKLVEVDLPQVTVLSFDELPADLTIQPMGRAQLALDV